MTGLVYNGLGAYSSEQLPRKASDFQAAFNNGDILNEERLWARLQTENPDNPDFTVYTRAIRDLQIHEGVYAKAEGREPVFAGPDIRECKDHHEIAGMLSVADEPIMAAPPVCEYA